MGLVPEDRKRQGLVLMMSGRENFSLVILDRLRRWGYRTLAEALRGVVGLYIVDTGNQNC